MLRSVAFRNFKALEQFSVSLRRTNVLVGPNNSGKSTVLDGFRALAAAVRYARRLRPVPIVGPGGKRMLGWQIPASSVPISTANIHSDYEDVEAQVIFTLDNGRRLILFFDESASCRLCLDADIGTISTTTQFMKTYPIDIALVPTLGPFEEDEELVPEENYARRSANSRRRHRLFRNIWHRKTPEEFGRLKALVEQTWPGMSIKSPEVSGYGPASLHMFCEENRRDREIYWAGFGFQVWLQFLTHLLDAHARSVLIVDEPDIYLHPDLQRRLFWLVQQRSAQCIMATHSIEIINEADPEDIIVVDKRRRVGKRVTDIAGMQEAVESLGSTQNIHLTKLSKGRKVLFVEGNDFSLLRRFARKLQLNRLAEGAALTVIPLGGFSQWPKIEDAAWTFENILRAEVKLSVLFDRDYRCADEINEFLARIGKFAPYCFVLERKELENYLLEPEPIARALSRRLAEQEGNVGRVSDDDVRELLDRITGALEKEVSAQCYAHRLRYYERSRFDQSTILHASLEWFENQWASLDARLELVPGKAVLSALNRELQQEYHVNLTHAMIVGAMVQREVAADLREILEAFEELASS